MTTHTTSPTETLRPGDVVVLRGVEYTVVECIHRFSLKESGGSDPISWVHLDLPRLTELVRQEFAKLAPKLAPKEVPPLAVGQKWRTRGGEDITIRADRLDGYFRADGLAVNDWWYRSHHSSKKMHSPGELPESHPDTLVELIADAPAPEKPLGKDEVTLVLSEEEAQFLQQLIGNFVFGTGPARKCNDSVYEKLKDIGCFATETYPLSSRDGKIWCDEVKNPLFNTNEVWRTEKKYLVRVCMVRSDGAAFVRTIHNTKDAAIIYGDEGTREVSADGVIVASGDKLIEKISD